MLLSMTRQSVKVRRTILVFNTLVICLRGRPVTLERFVPRRGLPRYSGRCQGEARPCLDCTEALSGLRFWIEGWYIQVVTDGSVNILLRSATSLTPINFFLHSSFFPLFLFLSSSRITTLNHGSSHRTLLPSCSRPLRTLPRLGLREQHTRRCFPRRQTHHITPDQRQQSIQRDTLSRTRTLLRKPCPRAELLQLKQQQHHHHLRQ